MQYLLEAEFKDLSPTSNEESDLEFALTKASSGDDSSIGDITTYTVSITNKDRNNVQGMMLAEIRIPSCLTVNFETLERLQRENDIANFELLNDNTDVVLYWRGMAEGEAKEVKLSMTRSYTGDNCVARPSKAYLYYSEPESEVWAQ